jgi:hypothetical protein
VAKQSCLVCGRLPLDDHHLRFTQSRVLGRKISDEFIVPLCRGHHREVHRYEDEAAWWQKTGVDPTVLVRALWLETHPLLANPKNLTADVVDSPATVTTDRVKVKIDRRAGGRRAARKPKSGEDKVTHGVALSD